MPESDVVLEARRLLQTAHEAGETLRLLGGVAVRMRCPSALEPPFQRLCKDLDLAGYGRASKNLRALMLGAGYDEDKAFNALHGHQRLFFWDAANERQVDVFLDGMHMCHELDFRDSLARSSETLPLADLLMTKLQVVEINAKDLSDALAIQKDHSFGEGPDEVSLRRILGVVSDDWGLWRTMTQNLGKLRGFAEQFAGVEVAIQRISELESAMSSSSKSLRWKMRARIGDRVRWYTLPEEERHE